MTLPAGCFALKDLPRGPALDKLVKSTGWVELDPLMKIYPSQLIVATGLAGSGKSTFLFNLIINQCWHGHKAWLYAPENELYLFDKLRRMFNDHRHKGENVFDIFARDRCFVQSSNYEHYSDAPRDIEWILGNAFEVWKEYGIKHVLIDPWNELERARLHDENLTDYIGRCLMRVKMFARQTGCTMYMVAHPTKATVGREVTLADIEGSMHWFNKCDTGIIVKRQEKDTMVTVAKVREQPVAGTCGHHLFLVDQNTGIFHEQPGGTFL
jgi:twinkle protein